MVNFVWLVCGGGGGMLGEGLAEAASSPDRIT